MDDLQETNLQILKSLNENVVPLLEKISKSSSDFDVALLSGVLVLIGAILGHVVNLCLEKNRQLHTERINSENHRKETEKVLMSKQQIALKELSKILHKDIYINWQAPDYSDDEAYGDIANRLPEILEKLDSFNYEYAYVLPKKYLDMLGNATFACNQANWSGAYDTHSSHEVSDIKKEQTKIVLDNVAKCVSELKKKLYIEKETNE